MKLKLVAFLLCMGSPLWAGQTRVSWHGHAAFEIVTPKGHVLMIDPWLNNPKNPKAQDGKNAVDSVKKLDYILITHGHGDHVGDAPALAQKTGARLVATSELGQNLVKLYDYPKDQVGYDGLMNVGGHIKIAGGEVEVIMMPAVHSSGLKNPKAKEGDPDIVYGGNPVGFILRIQDGPSIYHTGDTAQFAQMEEFGDEPGLDLALINVGGHFGMELPEAVVCAQMLRAQVTVPQHFGTFPVLTQDANAIAQAFAENHVNYKILQPGETLIFEGRKLKR